MKSEIGLYLNDLLIWAFLASSVWFWVKAGCPYIWMMDEETYVSYHYIFVVIFVLFWLMVFFCCLGPFIVWVTGEDEDGPVTLRDSLRKSPHGQRPQVKQNFTRTTSLLSSQSNSPSVLRQIIHTENIHWLLLNYWESNVRRFSNR